MKFLRVGLVLTVVGVSFWQGAAPAKADPHALFFTAIAQKQLFFNVLAALDQADYVEPAGDNPCSQASSQPSEPCDPVLSREELADKLKAADFVTESDNHPALEATKTGLASTLTRGVTLDGTDLWTAHLLNQRALEHDRRNALSELVNVYCNVALGKCSGALTESDVFVTNPSLPAQDGLLGVAGTLLSGTNIYEEEAQKQYRNNQVDGGGAPIPYNPTVAAMWASAGADEQKQELLLTVAGTAARAVSQPTVPSGIFDHVEVDADGKVALKHTDERQNSSLLARLLRPFRGDVAYAQSQQGTGGNVSLQDQVMGTLYGVATLPARLLEVAIASQISTAAFHDSVTGPNGERAGYTLALQGGRDQNGELQTEGVSTSIEAPSYVASGAVEGLLNAITTNDVPQDAVVGPEPNGVEVVKPTGIEIIDQSQPQCYVPGENFGIKFTIRNHSTQPVRGLVRLSKARSSQGNSQDIIRDNGSARPATIAGGGNTPNLLTWRTTVAPGGEQIFEVNDELIPEYSGELAYTVTFNHSATIIGGTGTHRLRFARSNACTSGQVEGIRSGQVLQATTQNNPSDLENSGQALVRPHDEEEVSEALQALGRGQLGSSLLNQALGQ